MKTLFSFVSLALFLAISSCKKDDDNPANSSSYSASAEHNLLNISYGSDARNKYDIYLPANRSNQTPVLFIIHGGGWIGGSKNDFDNIMGNLRALFPTYAFVRLNYRLFDPAKPSVNKFPTQENDVKTCIEHVLSRNNNYVISTNFAIWGQSAGAHLAALYAYKYENNPYKPKAVIEQVGPTDMLTLYYQLPSGDLRNLLGQLIGDPATNDSLLYKSSSPVNYVKSTSCPTLIMHGTNDNVVPYEQAEILKNKLEKEKVTHTYKLYQGQGHGLEGVAIEAATEVVQFLQTHLK